MKFVGLLVLLGAIILPLRADEETVTFTGTVTSATGFDSSIGQGTVLTLTMHFDPTESPYRSYPDDEWFATSSNTLTVGDLSFGSDVDNIAVESDVNGSYGFSFNAGFGANYDQGFGAPNPTLDASTDIPLFSTDPTVSPTDALSNVRQLSLSTFSTGISETFTDYPLDWISGSPLSLTYNLTSFTITAPEPTTLALLVLSLAGLVVVLKSLDGRELAEEQR